jgi:catechol 2,3-dioxygenase-like lactoylglutathione lyase family enzyme
LIAARGVHHLAILVRDLPGAEQFYCGILGLAVLRRWPDADGTGERSVWVDTGDGAFLALERATGRAQGDEDEDEEGWHLVALRIEAGEREEWRQRFARAGVAVYRETGFTIYVRDPEGNRVGLSHYPVPAAGV